MPSIVNQKESQEVYHDFAFPHKLEGVLPVLYDDHQGNVIYRIPRRYPSLARVVDTARLRSLDRWRRPASRRCARTRWSSNRARTHPR